MKIEQIKTNEQYNEALALAEALMHAEKDTTEGKKLDLVVSAIEDYEKMNINLDK